jgi:hypothetical protein
VTVAVLPPVEAGTERLPSTKNTKRNTSTKSTKRNTSIKNQSIYPKAKKRTKIKKGAATGIVDVMIGEICIGSIFAFFFCISFLKH